MRTSEDPARRRALVIGWDDILRRRLHWILAEEGFDAVPAANLADALALARHEQFDVIVINTDWPEPVKESQIDALQREAPRTPILDVTRRAVNPRYNTDADAYLSKPFDATDLLEKVERLLAEPPNQTAPAD